MVERTRNLGGKFFGKPRLILVCRIDDDDDDDDDDDIVWIKRFLYRPHVRETDSSCQLLGVF
jgi:hypothetical protein